MKKLLLFFALISFSLLAKAQTSVYKAFKVDVDLGYAIPSAGTGTGGIKAGVTVTIEPHYRLSDDIAIGFRFEGAGLGYQESNGVSDKTHISILSSYCPTFEYYFAKGGFRPFGGAGAGIFSQETVSRTNGNTNFVPGATNFGFFPRLGFEAGHLRVSAAYDIVGNNSNYVAFTIGFFLGGGKK